MDFVLGVNRGTKNKNGTKNNDDLWLECSAVSFARAKIYFLIPLFVGFSNTMHNISGCCFVVITKNNKSDVEKVFMVNVIF